MGTNTALASAPIQVNAQGVVCRPATTKSVSLPTMRAVPIVWHLPHQVITDSWARCRFGATTTTTGSSSSGDGDGDGAVKGVTVEDRASGRTLAEYSQASGGALDADALGSLLPTEAAEGSA